MFDVKKGASEANFVAQIVEIAEHTFGQPEFSHYGNFQDAIKDRLVLRASEVEERVSESR